MFTSAVGPHAVGLEAKCNLFLAFTIIQKLI